MTIQKMQYQLSVYIDKPIHTYTYIYNWFLCEIVEWFVYKIFVSQPRQNPVLLPNVSKPSLAVYGQTKRQGRSAM